MSAQQNMGPWLSCCVMRSLCNSLELGQRSGGRVPGPPQGWFSPGLPRWAALILVGEPCGDHWLGIVPLQLPRWPQAGW